MTLAIDVTGDTQKFEQLQAGCLEFEQSRGEGKDATRYAAEPLRRNGKDWLVLPDGFTHKNAEILPDEIPEKEVTIVDIVKKVIENKDADALALEKKYREKGSANFDIESPTLIR